MFRILALIDSKLKEGLSAYEEDLNYFLLVLVWLLKLVYFRDAYRDFEEDEEDDELDDELEEEDDEDDDDEYFFLLFSLLLELFLFLLF